MDGVGGGSRSAWEEGGKGRFRGGGPNATGVSYSKETEPP